MKQAQFSMKTMFGAVLMVVLLIILVMIILGFSDMWNIEQDIGGALP